MQNSTGRNDVVYVFALRNGTREPLTVDVSFSGFPPGMVLFTPSLTGVPLRQASASGGCASGGASSARSPAHPARVYDVPAGGGPTIRLSNCRTA